MGAPTRVQSAIFPDVDLRRAGGPAPAAGVSHRSGSFTAGHLDRQRRRLARLVSSPGFGASGHYSFLIGRRFHRE